MNKNKISILFILRFYDALPGTTWLVNATQYGHGDVLDEFYYGAMDVREFGDVLMLNIVL